MSDFKTGTKVIIKGNENCFISGLYSSPTPIFQFDLFGDIFPTSSYWKDTLKATIQLVGKDNHFLIKSENKYYVFSNRYEEMELLNDYKILINN